MTSSGDLVAVVVGGSDDVFSDLSAADAALAAATVVYFVINDMIPRFPERPCVAVTLHPQKAAAWLAERKKAGLSAPTQVWAHHKGNFAGVTHATDDWRGSSGLFAVKVARQLGFSRIILCGVPMRAEDKHFVRKVRWNACDSFRIGWARRKAEIAPYVRSCSGWTAEQFGKPDGLFLSAS